jgi:hypothetical protein
VSRSPKPPGARATRFFANAAAAERFARRVANAYEARKAASQAAALAADDWREGVLETRLADWMAKYRSDRAAELVPDQAMNEIGLELAAIWPIFRDSIDAELTRNMKIMDYLKLAMIEMADRGSK